MQHESEALASQAMCSPRAVHETTALVPQRAEFPARARILARLLHVTRTHWDAALDDAELNRGR